MQNDKTKSNMNMKITKEEIDMIIKDNNEKMYHLDSDIRFSNDMMRIVIGGVDCSDDNYDKVIKLLEDVATQLYNPRNRDITEESSNYIKLTAKSMTENLRKISQEKNLQREDYNYVYRVFSEFETYLSYKTYMRKEVMDALFVKQPIRSTNKTFCLIRFFIKHYDKYNVSYEKKLSLIREKIEINKYLNNNSEYETQ